MTTPNDNTVVELDIRDDAADFAEDRAFQAVRDFRWRRSAARVVVIDDALSISDHESIYQVIQTSQAKLLCIAVGGPASRANGLALRTTELLNNISTATLWVGDPEGLSWPTDMHGPDAEGPSAMTTPQDTLRSLREILRMPEVFDRVLELADGLPYRVASPGHLVAAGQVGQVQLAAAQMASVHRIAGDPDHAGAPVTQADAAPDYWSLITTQDVGEVIGTARLRPDSKLYDLHRQTSRLLRQVGEEAVAVAGPLGPRLDEPPTEALDHTVAAGRGLAEFHREVRDLFGRIDIREGLSHATRDRLTYAGINMAELDGATHRDIAKRLKELAIDRFEQGMPLRNLAELFGDLAERATTAGSKGRQADLDAICPPPLLDQLATPPRLPWRLDNPWTLGTVALATLFGAAGPFGVITGIVLAVLWTAGVFAATTRRPVVGEHRLTFEPGLLLQLGAAGAGVAAGVSIAHAVPVPFVAGWACLAVPVIVLPLTLRRWWIRAVSAWALPELATRGLEANAALRDRLCDVAVKEWVANDARRFIARGAFEIATALAAVGQALDAWLPATRAGGPADVRTQASDELQRLITQDIRHVVGKVLDVSWGALEAGVFDDVADGVQQRTNSLLNQYSLHLENVGIDEPFQPDPGTSAAPRTRLVRTLWQQSTEINWLMYDAGAGTPMVQLCGPEDVFLLDGTRDGFALIRFAPRAARESVTASRPSGSPAADITWTGAGHIAGVLRLVPLRSDTVESGWSADAQGTDMYQ